MKMTDNEGGEVTGCTLSLFVRDIGRVVGKLDLWGLIT